MTKNYKCLCVNCDNIPVTPEHDYCWRHQCALTRPKKSTQTEQEKLSEKYPKYFKDVTGVKEIDTYHINMLFPVDDDTGCILHARKKLLIPGSRTGGKTMKDDIREARDTLNRWLQLMEAT